jgi:hypothetical protein
MVNRKCAVFVILDSTLYGGRKIIFNIWNLETNQVITGTPPEGVMPQTDLSVTHWWYPTGKNNEEYSQNDYFFSALDMMAYRIFERLSLKNDDIYMYRLNL